MKERILSLKIENTDNIEQPSYCKDVVQDAYNEFSAIERIIDLKQLSNEAFFEKVQSYKLKTFEEYNNARGKKFSESAIEKYYPGYIKNFNHIIEKIQSNQIKREELNTLIKALYTETKEALAA